MIERKNNCCVCSSFTGNGPSTEYRLYWYWTKPVLNNVIIRKRDVAFTDRVETYNKSYPGLLRKHRDDNGSIALARAQLYLY